MAQNAFMVDNIWILDDNIGGSLYMRSWKTEHRIRVGIILTLSHSPVAQDSILVPNAGFPEYQLRKLGYCIAI